MQSWPSYLLQRVEGRRRGAPQRHQLTARVATVAQEANGKGRRRGDRLHYADGLALRLEQRPCTWPGVTQFHVSHP